MRIWILFLNIHLHTLLSPLIKLSLFKEHITANLIVPHYNTILATATVDHISVNKITSEL